MAKRSAAHQLVQREGKVRDDYVCQSCGSKDHAEGHHIIEHQYFGTASLDNIVTLCHDCHVAVHRGVLDLVQF